MKARCTNPKHIGFHVYGGRGIRVCDAWTNDFEAFLAHVGPKPTPTHTIDRIDVNGHYEPGNVRWATYSEQSKNKRPRARLRPLEDRIQRLEAQLRALGEEPVK
jgi:hypothetical protein